LVLLLIPRKNGHRSAGLRETQGNTAANTAVAARDDSDTSAQVKLGIAFPGATAGYFTSL
jgi:hypothetical protein